MASRLALGAKGGCAAQSGGRKTMKRQGVSLEAGSETQTFSSQRVLPTARAQELDDGVLVCVCVLLCFFFVCYVRPRERFLAGRLVRHARRARH